MNADKTVLYSVDGAVARVTLNRPEKRNALNDAVIAGIKDGLKKASKDERVRVVVISGAGKDFCSGADLAALQKIANASVAENSEDARLLLELFLLIRQLPIPVVAAVTGRALAGGCGLATACDLVLAASSARFGYPEVKIGFVPAMVMAILRRNVSEKRAFELITCGAEVSADQAKLFGLVNHVFPEANFEEDVNQYVNEFEKMSASAISLTKTLLYQMDGMAFAEALETGADVNVIARLTDDCQQSIAKFLQKDRT
ncbi:MAG TPA: enoyl-CoA hydratase-related protein [Pyrinomonadaceae bacterium]|jgi:methylglutaconyl-CoA hydratase|nr:enoyl-CoA hydratase-related protein [Pyrinomonadaceae bacterium]